MIRPPTHSIFLSLLVISLLAVGCGDDPASGEGTNNSAGHWLDDFECPRLEMETFDDCYYEEGLRLGSEPERNPEFTQNLERFCDSTCRRSDGISISHTDTATDLRMLNGLEETYNLHVERTEFVSLNGVQDLKRIERNMEFRTSPKLRDLSELESLEQVGQDIYIRDMDGLRSLEGLESLDSVRYLTIEVNDELTSIEALQGLKSIEGATIEDNPELPTCQVEQLVESWGLADEDVTIANNGSGDCS